MSGPIYIVQRQGADGSWWDDARHDRLAGARDLARHVRDDYPLNIVRIVYLID